MLIDFFVVNQLIIAADELIEVCHRLAGITTVRFGIYILKVHNLKTEANCHLLKNISIGFTLVLDGTQGKLWVPHIVCFFNRLCH